MIVADRYASALMDLANEKGRVDDIRNDMRSLLGVERESREFSVLLKSPVVKADKKIAVLESIFKGRISDISMEFFRLIVRKHRENLLTDIAKAFEEQYKRDKNIFTAVVTTAQGLDEKTRARMHELVKSQLKGEVDLIEKVDPETIGGFVLRVGDRQVDRTVARQLANLKKELINKELN
jgi:F-type H+-transporting ATPase subunit delta